MAYFPNGSAGSVFEEQCDECRYGQGPCPIYSVQVEFNYPACNNKVASAILDRLVKNDGTCMMFKMDPERFAATEPPPDTARRMLDALATPSPR